MMEIQPLRVRSVSLAARCEICHQADCYDPASNVCSRCQDVLPFIAPSGTLRQPTFDSLERFWTMLLAGSRVGFVSSLVVVALYIAWRQTGFPDAHPIRNGTMFAEIGFLVGTFAGVLRHGGHAETPRIAAHNAILGFIFGGILTGLLYLLKFAAPDLDGADFLRFLAFCTFGGLIFALGGGFIGAVLSVLIPVDHPLRRRSTHF
ncbi:MAG: hypothetical protein SNJ67_13920 [Chloracidobacterium sp.]|uniref:Uncharacterized protein n=1 Tax=Chloracidobacterium validum TaxID=2821543 RepID=A0ABX8BAX4_9BACT|nr:hypothetical protein [Chloracidobacterium validum]QUW02220.1 hypothetical protein J8C06_07575 [Chloracidobacterium validum]